MSLAVVAAAFAFALPRVADYDEAWDHIGTMSIMGLVALVLAAIWNLITYWLLLAVALPGLTVWRAGISSQASTAVANTLPGGGALGTAVTWSMYRRWGFDREAIARAMAVSGSWNVFVKLLGPAVALGVLLAEGSAGDMPLALALVSTAALLVGITGGAVVISRRGAVRRLASWAETMAARVAPRAPDAVSWADRADGAVRRARELVVERWGPLSLTALLSHASLFLVLVVALRAVGVDDRSVTVGEALTAFAVVRVALVVPITPGGAGLTEVGLAGLLTAAGGPAAAVVAGVLVFRAVTWLLPVPLGAAAYLVWVHDGRHETAAAT